MKDAVAEARDSGAGVELGSGVDVVAVAQLDQFLSAYALVQRGGEFTGDRPPCRRCGPGFWRAPSGRRWRAPRQPLRRPRGPRQRATVCRRASVHQRRSRRPSDRAAPDVSRAATAPPRPDYEGSQRSPRNPATASAALIVDPLGEGNTTRLTPSTRRTLSGDRLTCPGWASDRLTATTASCSRPRAPRARRSTGTAPRRRRSPPPRSAWW